MPVIRSYPISFPSNDTFVESLQNLPLMRNYCELSFLARGLKYPRKREEKAEYMAKCAEFEIVPFSLLEVSSFNNRWYSSNAHKKYRPEELLFKDGRPHRLAFRGDFEPDFLKLLIEREYTLRKGKVLIVYDGQPKNIREGLISKLREGVNIFPDARVNLEDKKVTLRLEPNKLIRVTARMMDWYNRFKEVHAWN